MDRVLPLSMLHAGEVGEVVNLSGDERLVHRLMEKGVRTGCQLEALCPGDPFLIRVDDTRLSLRTDGQVEVLVRLS